MPTLKPKNMTYTHRHTYIHTYVRTYVRTYVCMYVCIYIYTHLYIYTYIYIHILYIYYTYIIYYIVILHRASAKRSLTILHQGLHNPQALTMASGLPAEPNGTEARTAHWQPDSAGVPRSHRVLNLGPQGTEIGPCSKRSWL